MRLFDLERFGDFRSTFAHSEQKNGQEMLSKALTRLYQYVFKVIARVPTSDAYIVNSRDGLLKTKEHIEKHLKNFTFTKDPLSIHKNIHSTKVKAVYQAIEKRVNALSLSLLSDAYMLEVLYRLGNAHPREAASAFVDFMLNKAVQEICASKEDYPGVSGHSFTKEMRTFPFEKFRYIYDLDINQMLPFMESYNLSLNRYDKSTNAYKEAFASYHFAKDPLQEAKDAIIAKAFSTIFSSFVTKYKAGNKEQRRIENRYQKAVAPYLGSAKKSGDLKKLDAQLEQILLKDSQLFEKLSPEHREQFIEKTAFCVAMCFSCGEKGEKLSLKKDYVETLHTSYANSTMRVVGTSENLPAEPRAKEPLARSYTEKILPQTKPKATEKQPVTFLARVKSVASLGWQKPSHF